MKSLTLFLLLFLCTEKLFSQKSYSKKAIRKHHMKVQDSKIKEKVILSLDTIFNMGVPYAILKKKKQIPYHDFTLYSLNNDQLIFIQARVSINRDQSHYYAFIFGKSNELAECEKYYGFNIAKTIVEHNLVNGNKIDPLNETKFLIKFPPKFSDTTIKTYIDEKPRRNNINNSNIYETINRNRETEFYFDEGKIMQDRQVIGRYKIAEDLTRFYLPNGIEVAQATKPDTLSNNWMVWRLKDGKKGSVQVLQKDALREIIRYLIKNLYL